MSVTQDQIQNAANSAMSGGNFSITLPPGASEAQIEGVQNQLMSDMGNVPGGSISIPNTTSASSSSTSMLSNIGTAAMALASGVALPSTLLSSASTAAGTAAPAITSSLGLPSWLSNLTLSQIAMISIGIIFVLAALFLFGFDQIGHNDNVQTAVKTVAKNPELLA